MKHAVAVQADKSLRLRLLASAGLLAVLLCGVAPALFGDTQYYEHSFFDNSAMPDAYFYSSGKASAPSTVELVRGHLPVNTKIFITPPNALQVAWQSALNGGWDAEIRVVNFRNRRIQFQGDTLYFWCYSQQGIAAADLPLVRLEDAGRNFSGPLPLGEFAGDLPAGRWLQVKIPLSRFVTASIHDFSPQNLRIIVFSQNAADGAKHTVVIDEIRIDSAEAAATSFALAAAPDNAAEQWKASSALPTPSRLSAKGYERHISLHWQLPDSASGGAADVTATSSVDSGAAGRIRTLHYLSFGGWSYFSADWHASAGNHALHGFCWTRREEVLLPRDGLERPISRVNAVRGGQRCHAHSGSAFYGR